jgi:hypothetical protein
MYTTQSQCNLRARHSLLWACLCCTQDLPLHIVCVCEVDTHVTELQLRVHTALQHVAGTLPAREGVSNTTEIVRLAWAKGSSEKVPKGASNVAELLHITEVPRAQKELEAMLDFAGTLVCVARCMRDSVFCAPANGACASCMCSCARICVTLTFVCRTQARASHFGA